MHQKERTTKSYTVASPYMQLLQSKKKVYGLKYHSSIVNNNSHLKPSHNQNTSIQSSGSVKGRPASSSLASHNKSGVKSNSSQKVKSTKSQNTKKKRIYTEQAQNFNQISSDPKLHQSLFVNIDNSRNQQLQSTQLAAKTLFPQSNNQHFVQKNNYLNNYDFLKKFSEFNAQLKDKHHEKEKSSHINFSGSKSQKSNKSTKSKGKTHEKHQQYSKSIAFDTINYNFIKSIQSLGLSEVDDLITLIDNCVQQANQYISFLASKVQSLKNQLMKCKAEEFELQRIIKEKNLELQKKDHTISKLKKEIETLKQQKLTQPLTTTEDDFKSKQIKKILEVLNEMNERNHFLQSKVKGLQEQLNVQRKEKLYTQDRQQEEQQWSSNADLNGRYKQKRKSSNSKDVYNQIHSKIDILNISIENGKKSTHNNNNYSYPVEQPKTDSKKYKFIKPKNK